MNIRGGGRLQKLQSPELNSEEILKVLQALKENPELTQRELSYKVGVSLGKVNFILKALINKGLIKAHNFKKSNRKKAYLYILTPSGLEEKARITYSFLKRKLQEYENLQDEIRLLKLEVGELDKASDQKSGSI